jgi:hypothetical protein
VAALSEVLAGVLAGLSGAAAGVGAWAWWQVRPARAFWVLLRASQVVAVVLALVAGVAAALGHRPDDGLFWVYSLVPVAVSFVAEQLRVLSAATVLEARGIEDAQELGGRSEAEQRSVVVAILRRETGVMALSALVVCFMALRAIGTAAGL